MPVSARGQAKWFIENLISSHLNTKLHGGHVNCDHSFSVKEQFLCKLMNTAKTLNDVGVRVRAAASTTAVVGLSAALIRTWRSQQVIRRG